MVSGEREREKKEMKKEGNVMTAIKKRVEKSTSTVVKRAIAHHHHHHGPLCGLFIFIFRRLALFTSDTPFFSFLYLLLYYCLPLPVILNKNEL